MITFAYTTVLPVERVVTCGSTGTSWWECQLRLLKQSEVYIDSNLNTGNWCVQYTSPTSTDVVKHSDLLRLHHRWASQTVLGDRYLSMTAWSLSISHAVFDVTLLIIWSARKAAAKDVGSLLAISCSWIILIRVVFLTFHICLQLLRSTFIDVCSLAPTVRIDKFRLRLCPGRRVGAGFCGWTEVGLQVTCSGQASYQIFCWLWLDPDTRVATLSISSLHQISNDQLVCSCCNGTFDPNNHWYTKKDVWRVQDWQHWQASKWKEIQSRFIDYLQLVCVLCSICKAIAKVCQKITLQES